MGKFWENDSGAAGAELEGKLSIFFYKFLELIDHFVTLYFYHFYSISVCRYLESISTILENSEIIGVLKIFNFSPDIFLFEFYSAVQFFYCYHRNILEQIEKLPKL